MMAIMTGDAKASSQSVQAAEYATPFLFTWVDGDPKSSHVTRLHCAVRDAANSTRALSCGFLCGLAG